MAFRERNKRGARAAFVSVALLAGTWFASSFAHADGEATDLSTEAGLIAHVRAALAQAALGDQVGVSIVDVRSGRALFSHNAATPLNPASNMKLITAAATLVELGADFHMLTGLYGQVQDGAVTGGLYIKGFGDPTLQDADLIALGQQLVARGVREVDEVVVDGSYFDEQILPPGFGDQPNEVSPFRAAVAAVSVNGNAFTMRINPGASADSPADVWLDAEGYFALTNTVTTAASGATNIVAVQAQKSDKLALKLSGNIVQGIAGVTYRRRVESPLYYAGYALVEALRTLRIQVPRRVRLAPTPKGTALLASHESPPLAAILPALGKHSDNFVAEMLLKVLGAERVGVPGRSELGAGVALQTLKRLGVPTAGMRIANGSGLFGGGKVSTGQLTKLLAMMYGSPAFQAEYVAQLAVGGVDGTLQKRLTQLPSPRVVRAKTGTLDDVIALSGYVLGRTPERVLAFSVIANGVHGKQNAARALADQIASDAAQHLWLAKMDAPPRSAGAVPTPASTPVTGPSPTP